MSVAARMPVNTKIFTVVILAFTIACLSRADVPIAFASSTTPELVSVGMDGLAVGGATGEPSISANGRYIAFASNAPGIVPDDTNGAFDVFVRDRTEGTTTRVSVASDGSQASPAFPALPDDSTVPRLSADGSLVVFQSWANNLFPWPTGQSPQCHPWCPGELGPHFYVHYMATGVTDMIDAAADGTPANDGPVPQAAQIVLSANGRYAAFGSNATNLVPDPPTTPGPQVYVKDLQTGAIERASVTTSGQTFDEPTGVGAPFAISNDGNIVVFQSSLPLDPSNPVDRIFVRNRATQTTRGFTCCYGSISPNPGGLSGDGSIFGSGLVGEIGYWDLEHENPAGATLIPGTVGTPLFNSDGSVFYFESQADSIGDGLGSGIFAFRLATGTITRMTAVSQLGLSVASQNGVYFSGATRESFVPTDTNEGLDVYVQTRSTEPPVISGFPANIVAPATAPSGARVSYATPLASDEIDGTDPVNCSPGSSSIFAIGVTVVHCVATDSVGQSSTASFTVTVADETPPTISNVPADISVVAKRASGIAVTYSTPTAVDPVDGAISVSCMPASGSTFPLGTTQVTCTATDSAANSSSTSFNVTVSSLTLRILTQPVSQTVIARESVTFTATAGGTPNPTVQWQQLAKGASWANIPGATSPIYTFTSSAGENGYRYRATFSNSTGTTSTRAAILTVEVPPEVTTQPTAETVAAGHKASFSAAAVGLPNPKVEWQQSRDGGLTFNDISGATGHTYTFKAGLSENGYYYRAVFTNAAGTVTTVPVMLSVS
jgi:hypothetical protein